MESYYHRADATIAHNFSLTASFMYIFIFNSMMSDVRVMDGGDALFRFYKKVLKDLCIWWCFSVWHFQKLDFSKIAIYCAFWEIELKCQTYLLWLAYIASWCQNTSDVRNYGRMKKCWWNKRSLSAAVTQKNQLWSSLWRQQSSRGMTPQLLGLIGH